MRPLSPFQYVTCINTNVLLSNKIIIVITILWLCNLDPESHTHTMRTHSPGAESVILVPFVPSGPG